MTKKEIVKTISDEIGLTQLKTKEIVQKTFDAIVETLVDERRIELRNFGVFEVKKRAARKARNPRTGAKVYVPEKYVVTFKPGKEMEERVRELERQAARPGQPPRATTWPAKMAKAKILPAVRLIAAKATTGIGRSAAGSNNSDLASTESPPAGSNGRQRAVGLALRSVRQIAIDRPTLNRYDSPRFHIWHISAAGRCLAAAAESATNQIRTDELAGLAGSFWRHRYACSARTVSRAGELPKHQINRNRNSNRCRPKDRPATLPRRQRRFCRRARSAR